MRYGIKFHTKLNGISETMPTPPVKRGRSQALLCKRNTALFYRYYYYFKICKMKYADVLLMLEAEFFLNGKSIYLHLKRNSDELLKVIESAPTVKKMRDAFPFFIWHVPDSKKSALTKIVFVDTNKAKGRR